MIFTHHCSLIKHHISFAAGKPVSPETCPRTFSPGTRMMRKLLAEPVTSTASSTQAGTTMKTSCMRLQGQGVQVTCLESQARRHARMDKAWASNVLTQKDSLTTRNSQRQKHSEIRMGWQSRFHGFMPESAGNCFHLPRSPASSTRSRGHKRSWWVLWPRVEWTS